MPVQYAFILPSTRCDIHCEHCFYETGHSERTEAVDYLEPLGPALDGMVRDGLQRQSAWSALLVQPTRTGAIPPKRPLRPPRR